MKAQKIGFLGFLVSVLSLLGQGANFSASADDFSNSVTSRISEKTIQGFAQSNGSSFNPRVSKNGRFVVFESTATNLVPDPYNTINWDSNVSNRRRVYLYDRQANNLELVSITGTNSSSPKTDIKADCYNPVVSNDGRYVAFTVEFKNTAPISSIVNVGSGDANHVNIAHEGQHIYVRDRLANDTMLVSQVTAKIRRQVVLNGVPQVEDDTTCGKRPQMETLTKRISARIIADCTNTPPYDNSSSRCSSMDGEFAVAKSDNARISSDGSFIVFDTDSNSLSFTAEVENFKPTPVAGANPWDFCCGAISCGAEVGFLNSLRSGGNGINYEFEWPLSPAYDDATYNEYYKDDGSTDNKIRDIYLRDGTNGIYSTKLLSNFCKLHEPGAQCDIEAEEDAIKPSISDDGSLISFQSKNQFGALDNNIGYDNGGSFPDSPTSGDDIFVVERSQFNGEIANIKRISNDTSRLLAGNGNSTNALLSADGRYVVFQSTASNLVSSDSNSLSDIFLFDRSFNRTLLCSKLSNGTQLNAASSDPTVSGSGEYISFESAATNTDYTGAFGAISQAYIAKVSKNSNGSIKDCSLQLASPGAGLGANQSALGTGIAVVPQTVVSGGVTSRIQRSSIVYESAASNLDSTVTDTNSVSDIFQAPICSELDRTTDTDGDGTTDCFDQCFNDPIKVEDSDSDSDGTANCEDGCPSDPQKSGAGTCGCGIADIDSDGDGSFDCKDACPNDPAKIAAGACGCGIPDTDANGNGTADCKDSTVPTPIATATPSATATPTIAPTIDLTNTFKNLTPIKPSLSRGRARGSLVLNQSTSNAPSGVDITGLKADFSCKEGGSTKIYRKNNTLGGVIKGFRSGAKCTVKVTLRGTFAGKSLLSQQSLSSNSVTVP